MTGELSMRGIKRGLVLEGELHGPAPTVLGERLGLRLTGKLNREQFGMNFASGPNTSAPVGREVKIELDIEAVPESRLDRDDAK